MNEKDEIELLRKFKERSGWSYQKLANHLGVHYQTLMGWFSKKNKPSLMALEKIRHFLMIKRIV